VTLVIIIVLVAMLAYAGSMGAAQAVSLDDAASGRLNGQRVQVSGAVVDGSYSSSSGIMAFAIANAEDESSDSTAQLKVNYQGQAATTFGSGIGAICTGKLDDNGVLQATEMVTKCPSKYESAEGAVTAGYLEQRGQQLVGQELKLAGYVQAGTLQSVNSDIRFVVYSNDGEVPVRYDGALPEGMDEQSSVVVSGALDAEGVFVATDVALGQV
jgi:cytochrome c-type biogenesis protein CcmE